MNDNLSNLVCGPGNHPGTECPKCGKNYHASVEIHKCDAADTEVPKIDPDAQRLLAFQQAEEGWAELLAASNKIQAAANVIKHGIRSIDGYEIQRALNKHKPNLIAEHLAGLKAHREQYKL